MPATTSTTIKPHSTSGSDSTPPAFLFWTSLTDQTSYLPGDEADSLGVNNEENDKNILPWAAGIGIGISAVSPIFIGGGISLWNAFKRREEARAEGGYIGWKNALWGGMKDTACLTIRSSPTSASLEEGDQDHLTLNDSSELNHDPERQKLVATAPFSITDETVF